MSAYKKNEHLKLWFSDVGPFLLTFLIDRATKIWATTLEQSMMFGPVKLELHYNHGIMLGNFSHIPPVMKLVTLTSLGMLIFCSYIFIRSFVPMKSMLLKSGIAVYVSGILSNVADRMIGEGGVVDFIAIKTATYHSPIWNLADNFQIVGIFLIGAGLYLDSKHFWYENDARKSLWVDFKFQLRHSLMVLSVGLLVGLVSSIVSFTFFKSALKELFVSPEQGDAYIYGFLMTLLCIQATLGLMALAFGAYLSKRVAGPLFAIKRHLTLILRGEASTFKLRTDDEFKEFEAPLNELGLKLKEELPPPLPANLLVFPERPADLPDLPEDEEAA